ncbi:ParA family protein [Candidatus Cytomitobacter primus]|uniref:Chromosome partitioning protein ParA n=1 Tax=Candidatus Cytomitobacter primus TaxID=2066024 RepID=A0A5C0UFF2_9PROT|nr:ParA family protein [Candidatus Cytomitobacter primus]QEK38509.1 ParA family protein [Candidatus Cytomitobacter primus]
MSEVKILSVTNQKGGVGKTTTCVNLSTALAALGKKVLLIDMDAQGNATTALSVDKDSDNNSYDLLVGSVKHSEEFAPNHIETFIPNLYCIPSSKNLSALDIELANTENREYILKHSLENIKDNYDYIFIDCPPALNMITLNAFVASNSLIIPVQCEFYSLEGIAQLLETIHAVQSQLNKDLKIEGILMTMFDKRNILANNVLKDVKEHFGDYLYDTIIPRNVRLSEAPSFGKPVIMYDINCSGSQAYLQLAKEFLER